MSNGRDTDESTNQPNLSRPSHPRDIATRHTLAFVSSHLKPESRIVEVGCGSGDLALALAEAGHTVVGLDASEAAVTTARKRGVDARAVTWPVFEDRPFDAVLFTRSLHHIPDLTGAVERARDLLHPEGAVLVEDFDFAGADPMARRWLAHAAELLRAVDILTVPEASFLARMIDADDPDTAWEHDHMHDLHRATAMETQLAACFAEVNGFSGPYLYRYLLEALPADGRGATVLDAALRFECALGMAQPQFWVGRRWVAKLPMAPV